MSGASSASRGARLTEVDKKLLNSLVGMRVSSKIGLPNKGVTIKRNEKGTNFLYDLETKAPAEGFDSVYPNFKAAKEAAKEVRQKLAFNGILFLNPPSSDYVKDNENAIKTALGYSDDSTGSQSSESASF